MEDEVYYSVERMINGVWYPQPIEGSNISDEYQCVKFFDNLIHSSIPLDKNAWRIVQVTKKILPQPTGK